MATVTRIQVISGRNGSTSISASETTSDEVFKYRVTFATTDGTALEACQATVGSPVAPDIGAIPAFQEQLGSTGKIVLHKSADQVTDQPTIWIVTVTFSFPKPGEQGKPTSGTPTKWNIKISGTGSPYEKETSRDWSGKAIANKAGELFTPRQKFQFYDERMTVTYDTDAPNWAEITGFPGYINDAIVTITINGTTRTFPIGSMKYDNYEYDLTIDPTGVHLTRVSLHFLIRTLDIFKPSTTVITTGTPTADDGGVASDPGGLWYPWQLVMDNTGLNELVSGGPVPLVDKNNISTTIERPLSLQGKKLTVGNTVRTVQFDIFKSHDFTTLLAEVST